MHAKPLVKQNPKLRKQSQIRTIHASLGIEGNTLSEEQITALIENKHVVGPQKDIKEVLNAFKVYNELKKFRYASEKDFLKAHKILMNERIENPGKYRSRHSERFKSRTHCAPPSKCKIPHV